MKEVTPSIDCYKIKTYLSDLEEEALTMALCGARFPFISIPFSINLSNTFTLSKILTRSQILIHVLVTVPCLRFSPVFTFQALQKASTFSTEKKLSYFYDFQKINKRTNFVFFFVLFWNARQWHAKTQDTLPRLLVSNKTY